MFKNVKKKTAGIATGVLCLSAAMLTVFILKFWCSGKNPGTEANMLGESGELKFDGIGEGELIEDVTFSKDCSFAYAIKSYSGGLASAGQKLIYCEKTAQGYGNQREIPLPDGKVPVTVNLSPDCKELYLSVAEGKEFEYSAESASARPAYSIKAVKASCKGNEIKELEELGDLNFNNCTKVMDIAKDGSILFSSGQSPFPDSPADLYMAVKAKKGYKANPVYIKDFGNYAIRDAAINDKGDCLAVMAQEKESDDGINALKLFISEKKGGYYLPMPEAGGFVEGNETLDGICGMSDGKIFYSAYKLRVTDGAMVTPVIKKAGDDAYIYSIDEDDACVTFSKTNHKVKWIDLNELGL